MVMLETTVDTTPAVLRHVYSKSSGAHVGHHGPHVLLAHAIDTSLQYFLAVLILGVLVRPLLLTAEHPR
jgi:hypothetical protein